MRRDVIMMKWLVSTEAEKKIRGVGGGGEMVSPRRMGNELIRRR